MTAPRAETILVIDDRKELVDGLRLSLEPAGYRVLGAGTGEEGLETARDARPDLIVLDLMLPGIDGFEVCKKLRAGGDQTPVIMLSARSADRPRRRSGEARI